MINSYVEKVIAHAAVNGGICRQGFVKDLVDKAAQVAPSLKITCDDIKNKVSNIKGPCEQQKVTPMIPYHTKHRLSPRCSPNNSDKEEEEEEEEEEGNSIVFEEMGTTGLVFGHDGSDNECEE